MSWQSDATQVDIQREREVEVIPFRCDSCERLATQGVHDPVTVQDICDDCIENERFKKECYCEDTEEQIEEQRKQFLKI